MSNELEMKLKEYGIKADKLKERSSNGYPAWCHIIYDYEAHIYFELRKGAEFQCNLIDGSNKDAPYIIVKTIKNEEDFKAVCNFIKFIKGE